MRRERVTGKPHEIPRARSLQDAGTTPKPGLPFASFRNDREPGGAGLRLECCRKAPAAEGDLCEGTGRSRAFELRLGEPPATSGGHLQPFGRGKATESCDFGGSNPGTSELGRKSCVCVVYVYVCMYVCMYTYTCVYVYMHACMHAWM